MTIVHEPTPGSLKYEPALVRGAVVAVLNAVLALIAGNTTALDATETIVLAIVGVVFPLVQAKLTRDKVIPVAKLDAQTDGL